MIQEPKSDDIIAVYLIVNGALNMSAGKIAAQTFQACQRLLRKADDAATENQRKMVEAWEEQGTRTICRIAQTEYLFHRACEELDGVVMIDEGLTEVPEDSSTILATWPLRRGELPRMLRHKRIPLLTSPLHEK